MANNTIIQQGKFTSDGEIKLLQLRSDVDWMSVYNITEAAAQNNGHGFKYYWQRGMSNTGIMDYHPAADHTVAVNTTAAAFYLKDTGTPSISASNATITAISNAATPVVSAASTAGVSNGSIVKIGAVASAYQLGGIDFTVDNVVEDTSFDLSYMSQLAVAGVAGSFRIITVPKQFYPKWRYITNITQAASAVITMSVTNLYEIGMKVKIKMPVQKSGGVDVWGMPQFNDIITTITAVDTVNNTITVDTNSTDFTAFNFATHANVLGVVLRYPIILPYGESTQYEYSNLLDDRVYNAAYIGMALASGITKPAGSVNDIIYWTAGKSFD